MLQCAPSTDHEVSEMSDELVRATALGGTVRAIAVDATGVARTLREAHDAGPVGAVALGRLATATLLLGASLKGRQQVGIQINGDGPLGELYAVADATGSVRATVTDPRVNLPVAGLASAIGMGRFAVTKKLDEDHEPYRGVIPIVHGEIGADLAEYLLSSEQIQSVVAVGERVGPEGFESAGGYMVQVFPGAGDADLEALEARVHALGAIGDALLDGGAEGVLRHLFPDGYEVATRYPVEMRCTCTREVYARHLVGLGTEELNRLTAEQEVTETKCHFCGTVYTFDREQMNALVYGAGLKEK